MNIIFVCTGNTCRSPMAAAEAMAQAKAASPRFDDVAITSCGIHARDGMPAMPQAQAVAEQHGLNLSTHRAQFLSPEHIAAADIIYTMTLSQAVLLQSAYPKMATKIRPLSRIDIDDPFGGDLMTYEKVYQDIKLAITDVMPDWIKED